MTQEESRILTKRKIRQAKNGVEITMALREHFKIVQKERAPVEYAEALRTWG